MRRRPPQSAKTRPRHGRFITRCINPCVRRKNSAGKNFPAMGVGVDQVAPGRMEQSETSCPQKPTTIRDIRTTSHCHTRPRRGLRQRLCRQCHADAERERRRKRARAKAVGPVLTRGAGPPDLSQAICKWRRQPFTPPRWAQRFCGNICGGKAATVVLEAERHRRLAEGREKPHGRFWLLEADVAPPFSLGVCCMNRGTAWDRPDNSSRAPVRSRSRWIPHLVERPKEVIVEIPKHREGARPETIRLSALQMGPHLHADVRVYLRGHPTGQGLVEHHDLIADIITGLQRSCGGGGGPKLLDPSKGLWYKGGTINIG